MILKHISIPELNFAKIWENGLIKIRALSKFDKYMTIFWLLGPFIFLIERNPADIWLTSISTIFLFNCIYKKNWSWLDQNWVKYCAVFWIFCLFSAILSEEPLFSAIRSISWVRFPLYVVAIQFWLGVDKDIKLLMLFITGVCLVIISCILITEFIYEPNFINRYGQLEKKVRLFWPYGDHMGGAYISTICLPVICFMVALLTTKKSMASWFMLFLVIMSILLALIFEGGRINLLTVVFSSFLTIFLYTKNKMKFFISVFVLLLSLVVIFSFNKDNINHYFKNFYSNIPIINLDTPYWGTWRGGIIEGLRNPIFGIGPNVHRIQCKSTQKLEKETNLKDVVGLEKLAFKLPGETVCANHPHNFYIQLFAETGIIGLIFASMMIFSILKKNYDPIKNNDYNILNIISFVVVLSIFFPLQQFGNFFGQWGNLFIWFAVGLCLEKTQKKIN